MKKNFVLSVLFLTVCLPFYAQNKASPLFINADDLYIVPGDENGPSAEGSGYHLFIRKKPGLESVMLVESNKDPNGKQTNYSYRAEEYNKINGDEIRYLNGKVLQTETSKYSLIDSTAEKDAKFGEAFHIYIPETVVFGYPWSRNGSIKVADGLFVNIRTFAKKYGDYTGNFCDNSFNISKRKTKAKKDSVTAKTTAVKETKETKKSESVEEKQIEKTGTDLSFEDSFESEENEIAPNYLYPEDEVDLEDSIAAPFVEEDDSEYEASDEETYEETEEEAESEEETESEAEEALSLGNDGDDEPDEPDMDIPSESAFVENDIYYVEATEEEEPEPVPEIPEDERDPVAEKAYDETGTDYDPSLIGRYDPFKELADNNDINRPYAENLEGADPDFVKKLEAYENYKRMLAEAAAEAAKKKEETVYVRPELGFRFITHDIDMIKVEGSEKDKIKNLYISRTEVTQRSYRKVMGTNPANNTGDYYPVESVSWYDVIVFCNTLSIRDGLVPCYSIKGARNPGSWGPVPTESSLEWNDVICDYKADGYRMLTVEEWQYAARGGVAKERGSYAGSTDVDSVAWFKANSEEMTHPIASKMPNACGLYDMCGNVSEWCMGETNSKERSVPVRGGNYTYEKKYCKWSFEDACQPWFAHYENGIRICRNAD